MKEIVITDISEYINLITKAHLYQVVSFEAEQDDLIYVLVKW